MSEKPPQSIPGHRPSQRPTDQADDDTATGNTVDSKFGEAQLTSLPVDYVDPRAPADVPPAPAPAPAEPPPMASFSIASDRPRIAPTPKPETPTADSRPRRGRGARVESELGTEPAASRPPTTLPTPEPVMHIPSASPFSSPAMNSTDVVVGLLTHAVRLLEEHQGRLTNADRTVLSSAGSMLDHLREQVQQRLSSSTSKSTRRTKSSSAKPKRTSAKSRSRSK